MLAQETVTYLDINMHWLTLLGAIVPLAVALIANARASSAVKGLLNLVLSVFAGGIAVAVEAEGHVPAEEWVFNMLLAFVLSVSSHYATWKATGAEAWVALKVPGGIGRPTPLSPPAAPTPPQRGGSGGAGAAPAP